MNWQEWECPECERIHLIVKGQDRNVPVRCSCGKEFKSLQILEAHGFVYDAATPGEQ